MTVTQMVTSPSPTDTSVTSVAASLARQHNFWAYIVGVACAACLLTSLFFLLFWYCRRRKKRANSQTKLLELDEACAGNLAKVQTGISEFSCDQQRFEAPTEIAHVASFTALRKPSTPVELETNKLGTPEKPPHTKR